MTTNITLLSLALAVSPWGQSKQMDEIKATLDRLPKLSEATVATGDWLVKNPRELAKAYHGPGPLDVTLDNGLVRRTFRLGPGVTTYSLQERTGGHEFLRAASPEATLTLNGTKVPVGGMTGQPDRAYLTPSWLDAMRPDPEAFQLLRVQFTVPEKPFDWTPKGRPAAGPWPPRGCAFTMSFTHPRHPGLLVDVAYELYDGAPAMMKKLVLRNVGQAPVRIDGYQSEVLALAEAQSEVDTPAGWTYPNLELLSDYSFGGMAGGEANRARKWSEDPAYTTQVNYRLQTPCLLTSEPPVGPGVIVPPGGKWASNRSFLLLYDTTERERRGLALRRAYRLLAPWTAESPIMLHLTTTDDAKARASIDQAAECGFEMVIFSFGSGLDMENFSEDNLLKFKKLADYGHERGLRVGGYSLLASRRIDDRNDVINPKTGKTGGAIFGNSPCLGSEWGEEYFRKVQTFLQRTGFDLLEHDGSYPGDLCASTNHPGHQGLEDSQWTQWRQITGFYAWCRARGIYLNVPDWYMLAGSNKTGMGYRETNWSLPRAQQHIHNRQNLFDGTWTKSPTMGWTFVPLTEYQGGGAAATIEPLKDNLADYERHLINNFAYGAQACYRGPRLYDAPETKAVVVKWVQWFKKHREVLEGDIIHLRRADGRDIDYALHVNPRGGEKAMLVVFNPTDAAVKREIKVPLHYAGLAGKASASVNDGPAKAVALDALETAKVVVDVPAGGFSYLTFRAPVKSG
ncbi:MAG: hypothetical protein KF857_04565 [Fimbriimonadaceae bacterium]|nr:hypothetical protein [Fimbriimonadaceae bacterium]